MKKIQNLLAVSFCAALIILGIQLRAAAQQTQESPRDLGKNAGTGETRLPEGTWELVRIEATQEPFLTLITRQKKGFLVDTREVKGVRLGMEGSKWDRLITTDFFFKNLPEKITTQILPGVYPDRSFRVLVKAAVTGEGVKEDEYRDKNNFVQMKCTTDVTLASGEIHRPSSEYPGGTRYTIYAGSKIPPSHGFGGGTDPWAFLKNGEFECGLRHVDFPREQDATLNFRLVLSEAGKAERENDTFYADVTFHFFYKWRPAFSRPASPTDTGLAPSDREGQYRWAQKQDASALESTLSSAAARLFNSPSASAEKLSSAFADVSVIIADRAGRANFPPGDKDAASLNWSNHKNWAARQGPKTALENLQQKLAAAFQHLSRSQKDLFFADVRVAIAKAEAGGPANETAAAPQTQNRPLVQPSKSVFSVNEEIAIDYYNAKGSGWDWVVVVDPNRTAEGKGPFSSIDEQYGKRFDPNDNSLKERNGTFTFRGLPEGEYEVRYVAWYLDGMAGANKVLAPVRFRVGNQVSAVPPSGPAPGANTPAAPGNRGKDLTGLWRNPGGNAIYRVRQIGTKFVWGIDAVPMGSWANVFHGQINGNLIDGVWEDLPGSPTIGGGRMLLKVESDCRFVRVSSVNPYGADVWVKKDSMCDVTGLTQRSNPSGMKPANKATNPATTNRQTPPANRGNTNTATAPSNNPNKLPIVEELPADNRPTTTSNKPTPRRDGKPPVVEEIPEDNTPTVAANKPAPRRDRKPPVVEEIPEDDTPKVASNRPRANPPRVEEIPETITNNPPAPSRPSGTTTNSTGASGTNQPKPKKEKKPRDPNKPNIWTLLGGAVREAITGQPPVAQAPQPSAPAPQTSGCQVGPYSLSALNQPRANEQVWMGFTAPAGRGTGSGDWVGVFRAGETQSTNDRLVTWMYLNSPDCIERFSLPAGQYDAYVFDASSFRATGNRSPISAGVRLVVNP